ncbi:MAG: HAD family phosphatase [Roseateles sp.]|uniref:HAD family hydrolase n=1 Tax=Roseateles sp. TaxID=1971397 RepID=UPI0039EACB6B
MRVVFDFGGVLFRWHPASFLARVWPHRVPDAQAGEAVAREFFQNYGGDWGAFDQGLIGMAETLDRIAARTGWPRHEVQQVADAVPGELALRTDTVALIEALRAAGRRLHYLSNMPEPYADHLERSFPLQRWFDGGVFSGRVKQSKPGAAIYELAARQFGARPEELLFLDDHPANVEAARALGWQALLFTDAAGARRELVARGLLSA